MQIIIVGTGILANELLTGLRARHNQVTPWAERDQGNEKSIVIHAGSGRELIDVAAYCHETHSPLIELATGSQMEAAPSGFPVVLCPNTNILMLKFMNMLNKSGHLFSDYNIEIIESHQTQKTSVPGTAVSIAHSLGLHAGDVRSVRDPDEQSTALQIPAEHLGRHAYHRIVVEDPACTVTMETRVFGASPYADGVARIILAICANALEDRIYEINEFVENGWL
ncbi:MAG TPA: dihydrodipicolinate reductase C-terminal domain-containing protein [Noviherbaspirillum sp.]|nr:dihydrodipicolinate reductase C-terminal domain-containing protein [Noviherbaspirillum sp.]